ncbi:MAG TPA: TIGR04222 domain-containing membrane protein, partial [Solirubrobacteraceae bacterium]|nr:TIGR04222 domain-containing membrane protein [Solirubrobacteraceae bacterium]
LAEGVPRVIGAALAGLAHMGLIEVRNDRTVVPLKPAPTSLTDPILRTVVNMVSRSAVPSSVEDIRNYAEPATEPVRAALQASGLLLNERAIWTGGLAIAAGGLAAFVGILLVTAAIGGNPANSVFWGLLVSFIPTGLLIRRRHRTRRGNAVLKRLQEDHVALRESTEHAPALLTPTDLAHAVAIYGPSILHGGPLNDVGQALKRERNSCGACGGCGGCGCGGCGGCG